MAESKSKSISKKRSWVKIKPVISNTYTGLKAFLLLIATLATIASGVIALQNWEEFSSWFNKQFRTKEYWLQAAQTLTPEANVRTFEEKLGLPVFTSKMAETGLVNRTFINDYFYTQAISDDSDRVVMFSVTIRRPDFNPSIPYLIDDNLVPIYKLGKSSYHDLSPDGEDLVGLQYLPSFRRTIYSEAYYYGNPGNYLYYIFSSNDAGAGELIYDIDNVKAITLKESGFFEGCDAEFLPFPGAGDSLKIDIDAYKSVRNVRPNTFTVTERSGSFFCQNKDLFSDLIIFGPDLDKVRLFDQVQGKQELPSGVK